MLLDFCEVNPQVTAEFLSHGAINAESVSICWHHHVSGNNRILFAAEWETQ